MLMEELAFIPLRENFYEFRFISGLVLLLINVGLLSRISFDARRLLKLNWGKLTRVEDDRWHAEIILVMQFVVWLIFIVAWISTSLIFDIESSDRHYFIVRDIYYATITNLMVATYATYYLVNRLNTDISKLRRSNRSFLQSERQSSDSREY